MRKFVLLAAVVIAISAALGWWRAAIATQPGGVPADAWRVPDMGAVDTAASAQRAKQIRATALFITTEQTERDAAANAGAVETGPGTAPPFPTIAAISTANNIPYVHLIDADGVFTRVTSGESLPSGWLIKTVDLRQVIAVFDGTETRFPVAAYLDTAFDAPDDISEDVEAGGEN